jgi:proteasome alpha subunit
MEDMQHQVMGYDRAATMFAPDGHILQVEYAEKTIRLGSASVGMVCKDGVVIISDRRQKDKLVVEESAMKLSEIDEHIMAVAAGITSDSRVLIDRARTLAQQHRVTYDSEPTTESIVRALADIKQQFTQYGGARPFGVSLMIGGYNGKPELYATEVTGNYLKYHAFAIGENDELIKSKLREEYKREMTCDEGVKLALKIFKDLQGDEYSKERFDVGIIRSDKKIVKKTGKDF